jgi:hypothetical protein
MKNAWNVFWRDGEGKKFVRSFPGEKPSESGAIEFAKNQRARGFTDVNVTSRRKAFAPPFNLRNSPEAGMLWCPYCLKWRHFMERAMKFKDFSTGPEWRCPVCSISINDAYVRRYNPVMYIKLAVRTVQLPSEKLIRQRAAGR